MRGFRSESLGLGGGWNGNFLANTLGREVHSIVQEFLHHPAVTIITMTKQP